MKSIYYDDSTGNLKEGMIWESEWGLGSKLLDRNLVYAKFVDAHGLEPVPLCYRGSNHAEDVRVDSIEVELFGGTLGNLVEMVDHGFMMVAEDFAKRLEASGLTGFRVRNAVKIVENQSRLKNPKLLLFEFDGKGGFCHRFKLKDALNLCPHCRRSQVICDYCGAIFDHCPSCGHELVVYGSEKNDADLIVLDNSQKTCVVANRDWDGSDVFSVHGMKGGVFVTTRARDWLEKAHVFEVIFKRALLDLTSP